MRVGMQMYVSHNLINRCNGKQSRHTDSRARMCRTSSQLWKAAGSMPTSAAYIGILIHQSINAIKAHPESEVLLRLKRHRPCHSTGTVILYSSTCNQLCNVHVQRCTQHANTVKAAFDFVWVARHYLDILYTVLLAHPAARPLPPPLCQAADTSAATVAAAAVQGNPGDSGGGGILRANAG